jgi:predicted O-methyltransferase YrrM
MDIDNRNLEDYILAHIDPEEPILSRLDHETNIKTINPRMLSGHLQGKILTMFCHMIHPMKVLEIGTFTGYSAICLARGLEQDGKIISIEKNDELESLIRKYFAAAGVEDRIDLRIGDASQIIPSLEGPFDLVFIDADKREYLNHFNLIFPKIAMGGYIIADNVLWSGKVAEAPKSSDAQTIGIMKFNDAIATDSRIEKVILPLRDGMTIMRKIKG